MKVKIYNQAGEVVGEEKLVSSIFDVPSNVGLLHQAVVRILANKRQVLAHTKDRSEVRGGGKKPWRQKGTGRARHGSSRSPIWVGGGVTFGPTKERNFTKKLNKKMRRAAMCMALSDKARNEQFLLLDKLELPRIKTKNFLEIINNLQSKLKKDLDKGVMVVLEDKNESISRSARNIRKIYVARAENLGLIDVLRYKHLLMTVSGLKKIEKLFK